MQEGEFCNTALPVHLQTNADVHFSQNFYKATRNADSSLTAFLTADRCRLPFCVTLPDCLLWVSSSNSPLTGILLPTTGRVEISSSNLCLVSRQNKKKRSSVWCTHFIVSRSCIQRVSGEFCILQSNGVRQLHKHPKIFGAAKSCQKKSKTFGFSKYIKGS